MPRPVIAIDGPAGSGKSTLARELAARLGLLYIDSGAMYRAVTLAAKKRHVDFGNIDALSELARHCTINLEGARVYLDGEEVENQLRTPEISSLTSGVIANVKGVREALVAKQQAMGAQGGVVMEGRDIGTVVFPKADLKVYFEVSPGERARRRMNDFRHRKIAFDEKKVLEDIQRRDAEDKGRPWGALKMAEDSVLMNGDGKTVEDLLNEILELLKTRGVQA